MINFNAVTDFSLDNEEQLVNWLASVIKNEDYKEGEINVILCNDEYLLKLNQQFLDHDTYTDIISFDYRVGKELHGDIYISVDRVEENAKTYEVEFSHELSRVMVHGILHFCGYKDKSSKDQKVMRAKENHYLDLLF
ncbi:MAG: rRNA maturation RNase YbeY [Bacteroidia bacterium]|nr:rRNA maturation RNase YbeY [Bacteroidia bacterium]NNF86172.1 rRNA maturation RNase YbeY [Winogradskyella sp.]NNL82952.1 rRNA maturation RNase YbeY [Winogradskyella sp.]RZW43372.1 MAG: rRNA maturation RNase YbeY [Flavobacteriaceae bacterium]